MDNKTDLNDIFKYITAFRTCPHENKRFIRNLMRVSVLILTLYYILYCLFLISYYNVCDLNQVPETHVFGQIHSLKVFYFSVRLFAGYFVVPSSYGLMIFNLTLIRELSNIDGKLKTLQVPRKNCFRFITDHNYQKRVQTVLVDCVKSYCENKS